MKTITCFSGFGTMLGNGIWLLDRWQAVFQPEWQINRADATEGERFHYLIPGVMTLGAGIADIAVAAVMAVHGVLYASRVIEADTRKGVFLMPDIQIRTSPGPGPGGLIIGMNGEF